MAPVAACRTAVPHSEPPPSRLVESGGRGVGAEDDILTTHDLLEQWREATRAAELAERLAKLAAESAIRSDQAAIGAAEIARMAERAAKSAERASRSARQAADRAASWARENRASNLADADRAVADTRAEETAARDRYHDAEREGRVRHGEGEAAGASTRSDPRRPR